MSQRRDQILLIANRLLHEHGVRKMTISAIAKRADIAVGSVYLEFRSKDDILIALTQQTLNAILRAMRKASMSTESYERRVYDVLWARTVGLVEATREGAHIQHFLQEGNCTVAEPLHKMFKSAQRDLLIDLLDAASDTHQMSINSPTLAAEALMMSTLCFEPPHLFEIDVKQLPARFDEVVSMILRGLFQ